MKKVLKFLGKVLKKVLNGLKKFFLIFWESKPVFSYADIQYMGGGYDEAERRRREKERTIVIVCNNKYKCEGCREERKK